MGGQINTNATHGSTNFDGSILSVSNANTTAGFSVVTYTGNQTSQATVGHGLNATPDWLIIKNRDKNVHWGIWHSSIGDSEILRFTDGDKTSPANPYFEPENNTNKVFSLGTNDETNYSGDEYVAYCFHNVEGYSKFGSYTYNSSTDGTFVYTGFKPKFVLIKKLGTASWWLVDAVRDNYNPTDSYILPDTADLDRSYTTADFLSNGFKIRNTSTAFNSGTHIYIAFAENPFKYALGE
jgi:hypothetical protein